MIKDVLKQNILIIEDDRKIALTLIEYFESMNFEIHWSSNGLEGLKMIKKMKPEIILCDLMMPKMSGDELFKEFKKYPNYNTIPFLFITANTSLDSKLNQLELGATDYIFKPFKFEELLFKVNNLLNFKKNLLTEKKQNNFNDLNIGFKSFEEKIDDFLLKNISEKFEIAELSKSLNMSSSTLDKKIRKQFSVNVSTYIREFRLEYAISLLRKGMENITEVSDKSGFNSSSYFSTSFKKYTSNTPKEFCKIIKKDNLP